MGLSVCFVVLDAYPLLNPTRKAGFGGAEVRAVALGKALAQLPDYEIIFVVRDYGQPPRETHDLITVYAHSGYRVTHRLPAAHALRYLVHYLEVVGQRLPNGLYHWLKKRFRGLPLPADWISVAAYLIPPRLTAIYRHIDADIYCVFGANPLGAEVGAYCRVAGKKMALFASSISDFSPAYHPDSLGCNDYQQPNSLCYHALMLAHLIFTQTETQKHDLQKHFGRDSVLLPNPVETMPRVQPMTPYLSRRHILWIGKSDRVKNPEPFLELARRFPEHPFLMVMNPSNRALHDKLAANKPSNVTLIDYIPLEEVETLFAQACLLVNTSRYEGFANTFLQAGKYGVPILSLAANPDEFITRHACGAVADGDFDQLATHLDTLLKDSALREQLSQNISRYVSTHHRLDRIVAHLDNALRELVSSEAQIAREEG